MIPPRDEPELRARLSRLGASRSAPSPRRRGFRCLARASAQGEVRPTEDGSLRRRMGVTSELDSARLYDRERLLASSRASGVPPPTFRIAALPVASAARRLPCRKTIGGEAPNDEVVTKFSLVSGSLGNGRTTCAPRRCALHRGRVPQDRLRAALSARAGQLWTRCVCWTMRTAGRGGGWKNKMPTP